MDYEPIETEEPQQETPDHAGEMLDLPLGWSPAGESRAAPAAEPVRVRPRRPRSRRRLWIVLGLLLVAAAVTVFLLLPKPPRAVAEPPSLDFPARRLATASEPQSFEIVNAGEKPMQVEQVLLSGAAAGDFRLESEDCTGRPLAAGETCTAAVHFEPAELGPRSAALELRGELANDPARLPLSGTGIAPRAELSRADVDFGRQPVGGSGGTEEVSVANAGTDTLTVASLRFDGAAAGDFRLEGDRCTRVAVEPGERCSFRVRFKPRAAGARQARLEIRSDAVPAAEPLGLAGVGEWSGPALELDAEAIDFGARRVGEAAATRTLRLVNRHGEAVQGIRVGLAGAKSFSVAEENCAGRSLAPGADCRVVVAFKPAAEGSAAGSVEFRHPAVQGSLSVPLTGRGVAPRLRLGAADLDFGEVRLDGGAATGSTVLENRGSAEVAIEALSLAGADAAAFGKSGDRCSGHTLGPGERCTVGLSFRPQREGAHRASLTVRPAPNEGPSAVALAGVGAAPRLVLDRDLLDFGDVRRTTAAEAQLVLSNPGTAPLHVSRLELVGEAAADYALVAEGCTAAPLAAGRSCTLRLRFAPVADGRRIARLRLGHDGVTGPSEVPLGGTGLPPPEPRLVADDRRIDFGPQPIGNRSAISTLVLRNQGTGQLLFRDFALTGAAAGDFYVVDATCQAAPHLVPGSDCAVGVRFVPTASGERRARLVVRSNSVGGDVAVDLSGEGLASGLP